MCIAGFCRGAYCIIQQIGTAITVSGMTTVFGFAALMISIFGIISNFSTVTVISVFFAHASAIIVMPAILVLVSAFEEKEHDHNSPIPQLPVLES
jgi:uncharacterized protein